MVKFFQKIKKYINYSARISKKNGGNSATELFNLMECKIKTGHGPEAYLMYEFYNKNRENWKSYLNKRQMCDLLFEVNNKTEFWMFDDKIAFYLLCKKFEISSPRVLFSVNAPKKYEDIADIHNFSDFKSIIQRYDGKKIIFKPVKGSHGEGIFSTVIRKEGVIDQQKNEFYQYKNFYENLTHASKTYMAQKLINPHSDLKKIMPSPACGMIRVVTFLMKDQNVVVPYAGMTIPRHGSVISNFMHGINGNLTAAINISSGRLNDSIGLDQDGFVQFHSCHPDTQISFNDIIVPRWDEVVALCKNSALVFNTIRFIGWDVAVTDENILILEANVMCDPDGLQLNTQTGFKAEIESLIGL